MRKVLRITAITIGSLLLLMILLPVLLKGRIEEEVKKRINQQIGAQVEWSRFSASLFRGFPTLSVSLHQFTITGETPFEGDTIASLERFELRMDPFGVLRKHVTVHKVLLHRPVIRGEVLENGLANWELFPEEAPVDVQDSDNKDDTSAEGDGDDTSAEGDGDDMVFSLKKLVVSDGNLQYVDRASGLDVSVASMDLDLRGDFSAELTDLALFLEMQDLDAAVNGIRYLDGGKVTLELKAEADFVENRYNLTKSELRLNDLALEVNGSFALHDDAGVSMDLRYQTKETSFQTLLSLIPAIYRNEYESLGTEGKFTLEGDIQGTLKDTILPDVTAVLQVTDGAFAYPDLPRDVSDVQMNVKVQYKGTDLDASLLEIERLHFQMGEDPFDMRLYIAHPFSDMHVAGAAVGTIDFSSIGDIVPLEDIQLGGVLDTDLRWDTRMSTIEEERYDEVDLEGFLTVSDFIMDIPDIPVPVVLHHLNMAFTPRLVELQSLKLSLGSSDLQMEGQLYNFIPYIFDNQVVSGSLAVTSTLLNTDELTSHGEDEPQDEPRDEPSVDSLSVQSEEDLAAVAPPDSLAVPLAFEIPEKVDFSLSVNMDRVEMDQIVATGVEGGVRLDKGTLYLDHLKSEMLQGTIDLNGTADTRGDYMNVEASIVVNGIDIPTAYEQLVSVERLAPMVRYCRGRANANMQYSSYLDNNLTPLYESINAKGKIYTEDLQIYNLQGFVSISDMIRNEKFREMAPDEVEIDFTILNGRVVVDPFDIDFDDSRITVAGSHGLDHSLDYLVNMDIAKKDLGDGAMGMVNSMTMMARTMGLQVTPSDHVNVKATITGTFNKPNLKTDLSGNLGTPGASIREQMEKKVAEEIETAEKELLEEASAKAAQIIAEAEKEADRMVEEARKNGEKLVKEAELQGENLIREASSNPLQKLAAERAARELKSQAEKQSERVVREAEKKAEEMVARAREEASRL
jgi:vacuolar-type H+-ATPase subunit H